MTTTFAQGYALGWELFGPRGADAQGCTLGSNSEVFSLLGGPRRSLKSTAAESPITTQDSPSPVSGPFRGRGPKTSHRQSLFRSAASRRIFCAT